MRLNHNRLFALWVFVVLLQLTSRFVFAQGTTFTYQGKLSDGGSPANGTYDMQFKLFDIATVGTGTQVGATITRSSVEVTEGAFTVQLNFGSGAFTGPSRFLEMGTRPAGSTGDYTIASPRERITSSPYAIRSLSAASADNATQLGGVPSSTYVQDSDPRLIDARPPTTGSSGYIQNSSIQQPGASFNISGNGIIGGVLSASTISGGTVDAATHYNLGGNRVLSLAGTNTFAGWGAGQSNTTGTDNAFFGLNAGKANTYGYSNSFFGTNAGLANTNGQTNSFFGESAGRSNTWGGSNSFFGKDAGHSNTTASANSFVGRSAGQLNTTGSNNSFFGYFAGYSNTTADFNSFFGESAGLSTTTGGSNAFFGSDAGKYNSAGSSNVFLGTKAAEQNTTGSNNVFIGTNVADSNTTGSNNVFVGSDAGSSNTTGSNNTVIGRYANIAFPWISYGTAIGAGALVWDSNTIQLGRNIDQVRVTGSLKINILGLQGTDPLCLSASYAVSYCSSSLRYKTDVTPFANGLSLVRQLRPITFRWKTDGRSDVGFGAEDVARVAPLFVTHNPQGEVEGVKYDRITVVLVNAVKEQQSQIEQQQKEIDSLKEVVCLDHPNAGICKRNALRAGSQAQ